MVGCINVRYLISKLGCNLSGCYTVELLSETYGVKY